MPKTLQFRRGTTGELSTITGAVGELFVDTTKDIVVVSDGVTAGGFPLQSELESGVNIKTINGTSVLGSGDIVIAGGDYGNANVAAYLPTYTGGLVSLTGDVTTTGNISGNYIQGNGAFITGITACASPGGSNTQIQFNNNGVMGGSANLTFDGASVTVSGTMTAGNFIGDGSQLTGVTATAAPAGNSGAVQYNANGSTAGSDAFTTNGQDVFLTGDLLVPVIKTSSGVPLSLKPDNGNMVIEGTNGNTRVEIKRGSNSGGNATISMDGSLGRIFLTSGFNPSSGITITGQSSAIATTGPLLVGEFTGSESAGLPGQVLTSNGDGNAMSWTDAGGGGNVDLSEIAQDVLPIFSDVFDIGSVDKRWYDVFVSNKVDIGGAEITGSEAGVVVDALLVDKLLFTDNMITPDNSTALEYEGDKGVLIINGNLDVEGDWMQVPVVADTPEDPILTTGEAGMLRYNQDTDAFEGYTTEWAALGGGGGGVSQIIAGTGVTISPNDGTGAVTINAAGGGVSQIIAGTGVTISPNDGTGAVTINAAGGGGGAIEEVGFNSLSSVGLGAGTTGSFNNFFGNYAGGLNTTGCNNNFFGQQAGQLNTSGSYNNFFGFNAGRINSSGAHNNFFGLSAGNYNTTGSHNTFFGFNAGRTNTTGSHNTFFGCSAGLYNTTGSNNTFFGQDAGRTNITGSNNTFFGQCAGRANTTGCQNNFFGRYAGRANTSGCNNNFFGFGAGQCNTTGRHNNFFGQCAGRNNTTGNNNTFFGNSAGQCNTTGNYNTFFGQYAGQYGASSVLNNFFGANAGRSTTGRSNNFFGLSAGRYNTTGSHNTFFGENAGCRNTTGSHNTFFGNSVGFFNTTGCNNNFFGQCAGQCNTTGSYNNFFGQCAGFCNTTGNNNTFFGNSAGRTNTTGSNNTFFGSFAGACSTTGSNNTFFGENAGRTNTTGNNNTFFGSSAGRCNTTGNHNTFFGSFAGHYNTTGSNNTFFGCNAGLYNTTGSYNNFFGENAGCRNTTGGSNNFFGTNAGRCNTTGGYNNFFGFSAGRYNTTGSSNNFFGPSAGNYNTTGCQNNFMGTAAGRYNTGGNNNNFFGAYAGRTNTDGSHNTFFGLSAGRSNTTGCLNNFFGQCAGLCNTDGSDNNFFGAFTGRYNTSGNSNTFFGFSAGASNTNGSHNIFMGSNAGRYNTSGSNNLLFGHYAGDNTAVSPRGLATITTQSNRIIMGNDAHTCAQIQIAWTTVSDARDKCIYGAIDRGLGFLKNVNPIEFAFKDRVTGEIRDPAGKRRYGFSAQDILALEGDNPVIVSTENPDQLQMTNDYLIPILVNAVKELSAQVEELKSRLDQLTQ